jgi:hypothetical protein
MSALSFSVASASPCSVASALGSAVANDTLLMNPGVYPDVFDLSFPLTLQAVPTHLLDGSVILTGGALSHWPKTHWL